LFPAYISIRVASSTVRRSYYYVYSYRTRARKDATKHVFVIRLNSRMEFRLVFFSFFRTVSNTFREIACCFIHAEHASLLCATHACTYESLSFARFGFRLHVFFCVYCRRRIENNADNSEYSRLSTGFFSPTYVRPCPPFEYRYRRLM